MEDKLVNCKNCQYYFEKNIQNTTHCGCIKNSEKHPIPNILGIEDNCPLSLRTCYIEKGEKKHGKNSNTKGDRRNFRNKISNNR